MDSAVVTFSLKASTGYTQSGTSGKISPEAWGDIYRMLCNQPVKPIKDIREVLASSVPDDVKLRAIETLVNDACEKVKAPT